MVYIILFIYNIVVMPLAFILVHIAMLFSGKIREGVIGRYRQNYRFAKDPDRPLILFHTASMGEYEHIRTVHREIRRICPVDSYLVNMFFSPSGFKHAKRDQGTDQFLYAPFDTLPAVWRLMKKLQPKALVIAKHDIWPNQLFVAWLLNIPIIVINASLSSRAGRLKWGASFLHRYLYRFADHFYTVSKTDRSLYLKLVDEKRVTVSGDTKFDQVLVRKQHAATTDLLPAAFADKPVIVLGSIWPADLAGIRSGLEKLMAKYPDVHFLVVPHEPADKFIQSLGQVFSTYCRFSRLAEYNNEKTIVVDSIGHLATLYKYGTIAYVGGSFKEGIHNVMEAAVYGQPVLMGPYYSNSSEAVKIIERNEGGYSIKNGDEFFHQIDRFLESPELLKNAGAKAMRFVDKRLGASPFIAEKICELLVKNK
jgi:3-deoxy-D-manno-octulosonic-acid transferase